MWCDQQLLSWGGNPRGAYAKVCKLQDRKKSWALIGQFSQWLPLVLVIFWLGGLLLCGNAAGPEASFSLVDWTPRESHSFACVTK